MSNNKKPTTIQEYLSTITPDRIDAITRLRKVINEHIPEGFEECLNYGMIWRVIPHSIYPDGYHCDPKLPLPFMNLASQKSHIGVYHMGIYSLPNLKSWFEEEYKKLVPTKLNMWKSCIRFKNTKHIPYELIWELASKLTVEQVIAFYEEVRKK